VAGQTDPGLKDVPTGPAKEVENPVRLRVVRLSARRRTERDAVLGSIFPFAVRCSLFAVGRCPTLPLPHGETKIVGSNLTSRPPPPTQPIVVGV
jgi:hypothetical protein